MVIVEKLKEEFGIRGVQGRGPCIVIPKGKFDVSWEERLKSEGCRLEFNVDLPGGDQCTVIKIPEALLVGEKEVFRPAAPAQETLAQRRTRILQDPLSRWTPKEEVKLLELWNDPAKMKLKEIAEHFPRRSEHAVKNKIQKLREAGHIESRFQSGKKKPLEKAVPKPSRKHASPEVHTSVPTPVPRAVPTESPPASPSEAATESPPPRDPLLKEILDLLLRHFEHRVTFEFYCDSCSSRGTGEDKKVWKQCPMCGGPLIIWDVE